MERLSIINRGEKMNLLATFSQVNFFPIPFDFNKNNKDEYLQSTKDYTNQKREILEVEISEPKQKNNLILSREVVSVIGENARNRFNEFKTYPNGWYGGKGKEISRGSIFTFEQFVKSLPELKRARPSLFMTLEGNLSLGLEDKNGQSIEVEFYSDKAEYFIESLNEESEVRLSNILELTKKLRKLLK